jgi:3-hydroxymyristoyl/3-hydroxydecanoyl-(acyl carrier protein) dehydratase
MIHRFIWHFPIDHPALPGHFPGQPIAPGAVLLDRLELYAQRVPEIAGRTLRLEHGKFLQVCEAGDILTFVLQVREDGAFAFRIECDSGVLAQGLMVENRPSST